jgi:hypothetical protein
MSGMKISQLLYLSVDDSEESDDDLDDDDDDDDDDDERFKIQFYIPSQGK